MIFMNPLNNSIDGVDSICDAETVSEKVSCDICGKCYKGKRGLAVHMSRSKCKVAKMVSELPRVHVEIEEVDEKLLPQCSVCHRSFKSNQGLKQHHSKSMCADVLSLREVDSISAHQSHFSTEYGRPLPSQDQHHSTKARHDYVADKEKLDRLKHRQEVDWPRMADNARWQQLDQLVVGQLPEKATAEKRLAQLDVVLYEEALRLFGPKVGKNFKPFKSNRQAQIKKIRGNINEIGRKAKTAGDEEEELGYLCILDELKEKRRKLVKAEHSRKRRWKKKNCRGRFFRDPFGVAREVLEPKQKSVPLNVSKEVLDNYVMELASDDLRDVDLSPLEGLNEILVPAVPFKEGQFPRSLFDKILKKRRNKSASGPNKIPYKLYKKCPQLASYIYGVYRSFLSNNKIRIPLNWRISDGILIPKKQGADGTNHQDYRQIALMNVEGKLWWSLVSHRFYDHLVVNNKFIDTTIQKGSIRETPGCVEHTAMVWTALKDAKKNNKDVVALWLDLANAYGSVPHKLIIFALRRYGVPQQWIDTIVDYYWGLWGRSSTKSVKSEWFQYQRGIFAGCTISVILFLVAFNIFLEYIKLGTPDPYILQSGNILEMFRAFMDDLSILSSSILGGGESLRRTKEVLDWGRMGLRANKSRSLILNKGKPIELEPFYVDGECIPSLQRAPLKTLGRFYNIKLDDAESRKKLRQLAIEGLSNIDSSWLAGFQKVWTLHHLLVPKLQWQLMMYEISMSWVEDLERTFSKHIRKWLGVSKSLTDVALYSKRTPCPFPIESLVTTFKRTKVNVFLQLSQSKDDQVRKSFTEVQRGTKWSASLAVEKATQRVEHKKLVGTLAHGKGGLGFGRRYAKHKLGRGEITEEIKNESEEQLYLKAVQQPLQGQWVAWKDCIQRDLSWRTMFSTKPNLLRFSVGATFNTLASESNKLRWGLVENATCLLCEDEKTTCNIQHVLTGCRFSLSNGRYRFRHDQVLKAIAHGICEYLQTGKKKKVRVGVDFIREGEKPTKRLQKRYDQTGILDSASDWTLLVDLDRNLKFPDHIYVTNKRPDIVLYSGISKQVILLELTCPCEERFSDSHSQKLLRYVGLIAECQSAGWKSHLFAVEVGARGYASESLKHCLKALGLNEQRVSKCIREACNAALRSSFWIWIKREEKEWGANHQPKDIYKKTIKEKIPVEKTSKFSRKSENSKKDNYKQSSTHRTINGKSENSTKDIFKQPSIHRTIKEKVIDRSLVPTCGLRNLGNTCYMNSVIQSLFQLWGQCSRPNNHLCKLLWDVFSKMKSQSKVISVYSFRQNFISSNVMFRPKVAHDATEFLQALLQSLDGTIAGESFKGIDSVVRECIACKGQSVVEQVFTTLSIPLCDRVCSIQDLFCSYRKNEQIKFKCKCGSQISNRQHSIKELPSILCLSLKRFEMNGSVSRKVGTKVLNPFSQIQIQNTRYSLRSVIIHSGSKESGHYVSLVHYHPDWWICNDAIVHKVDMNKALTAAEDGYIFIFRKL